MICTTLQHKNLAQIQQILEGLEMAEIRLDRCELSDADIELLFSSSDVPLVATCRIAEVGARAAEEKLMKAIEAGAKYADLEIEAPAPIGKRIRHACQEYGTMLIRSFHDFHGTAPLEVLQSQVDKCSKFGADVVKIVTTSHGDADNAIVLSLYESNPPSRLIAFAMGAEGRATRVDCLRMGAPYTYACLSGEAAAPGQWDVADMAAAVYGGHRFVKPAEALRMPASKSVAQRAIIAAALAEGTSHLSGYTPCGDNESALDVARALGADVTVDGTTVTIRGIAATPGALALSELNVGESGFLTRLIIPVLAVLASGPVRITGEKTLLRRPLAGAQDIMAAFGVTLVSENPAPRKTDCLVPLSVNGPLVPGRADVSGRDGSQLISGLLTALPLCSGPSTVNVSDPKSIPYMFITMDILRKFGIDIINEMEGDEEFLETQDWSLCTGMSFRIKGGQRLHAADINIEADWSGAAAFMVAGAVFGGVELEGLDTQSLQADLSIMDILMDAGASMSQLEGETPTTGPLHIQRAPLDAFDTDANNCPDLFPMIAVLAAFCEGESHILGVGRLTHKESDRAAAIVDMLTRMGVPARIHEDELTISGMGLTRRLLTGNLLRGGEFTSSHDHRMVMALKVASLGASSPIVIDDVDCVAKSFPSFMDLFDLL